MFTSPRTCSFFFFNDTATTEIYTLSLHDALPIWFSGTNLTLTWLTGQFPSFGVRVQGPSVSYTKTVMDASGLGSEDRKSTRLNSNHLVISYAVFCLKKKKRYHLT